VVQDQLVYFSLARCGAGLFIATYQLKVVFGSLLASLVLGRALPRGKQAAVGLLYLGISLVHCAAYAQREMGEGTQHGSAELFVQKVVQQQRWDVGIAAAAAAALCSAAAGTYSEAVLKGRASQHPPPSLWLANLRLSAWGSAAGLLAVWVQDRQAAWAPLHGSGGGFLRGYTRRVWLLVGVQSAGGLVVSACLRYHSNVSKNFAQGISSLLIFFVSCTALGEPASPLFVVGAVLVVVANVLYRC
jgi:UDP-sugar transporter A1/2/3